jgi:16S rRNA (cytosine1402-N4)-methyltransferase
MLSECINALDIKPNGVYVDVTYGGGGHSTAILERLGKDGRLVAFDQDFDAQKNVLTDNRLIFSDQNFRSLEKVLRLNGIEKVDGILADLGVSSYQLDNRSY